MKLLFQGINAWDETENLREDVHYHLDQLQLLVCEMTQHMGRFNTLEERKIVAAVKRKYENIVRE